VLGAVIVAALPFRSMDAAERPIDVQHSRVTVFVSKAGLFSAFADNHTITAPIASGALSEAAPLSVRLVVNAADLDVLDPNSSADTRGDVRTRMLSADVLDVTRFPTIAFESTRVEPSGENRWNVAGRLTIHGVTRTVTFATVRLNDRYRGQVEIRQRDFGITPIRVAGGTVRVRDELKVEFEISPM
jgi:polyisoprenoid-binding protein YceI